MHWIHLAQARTGHASGVQYKGVYDYLRRQKGNGKIICPLSLTHYMELHATGSYERRTDVATVMAELSSFRTIATTSVLQVAEIDHALQKHFGKPAEPEPIKPFGVGVVFAGSGKTEAMRRAGNEEAMDNLARAIGGTDTGRQLESEYMALTEFKLLRGPHRSQLKNLRENYGYAPEDAEAVVNKRVAQEEALAQQFIANSKQMNDIDNIVAARYLYWELFDPLYKALNKIGMTIWDFVALGRDGITQFVHDIPTADILITFTKANLKNLNRARKKNDIHDMDALAIAVPYCDIVVTEKHAYTQLLEAGVERKYCTKLLKKLENLPSALERLPVLKL